LLANFKRKNFACKWVGATQTVAHGYDRPQLSPKEFLLAVMHAPNLPLATRMDAAVKLLRIVYIDDDYVPGAR
jgi:hypothetical protein